MPNQQIIKKTARNILLTPTECARMLNVAPVTLRKWAQKGMLEAIVTPGGHRRYTVEEISGFADKHNLPIIMIKMKQNEF